MKNQATPPRSFNTVRRSNREQRIKRRRCQRVVLLLVFAVVLLILTALIALSVGALIQAIANRPGPNPDPGPDPGELVYTQATQQNSDVHRGELIIVNADNEYVFPAVNTLRSIYDNRTKCGGSNPYQLKDNNARLHPDAFNALDTMLVQYYTVSEHDSSVEVGSTYRSEDEQRALSSATKPGHSDHHTGYCLELHTIPTASLASDHWIYKHCAEYGFIVRYPAAKSAETGISGYPNCFRYVGIPHATYITQNGLCLEEYVALLQKDYANGNHLKITDAAKKNYEVYYVSASADDITTLSVPAEYRYTVSGDNMKGFIITVYLDEPIK